MDPVVRMIDANLNRAREGLRVMEDCARFALDRRDLCESLKDVRHGVTASERELGVDATLLAASRDSMGDVGTDVPAPETSAQRATLATIVGAAAGRAGEALRVLEECAKVLGRDKASRSFQDARYRLYDAHKALTLSLGAARAKRWTLCALITESLCAHHTWERVAELALEGGADCLQLREKNLTDRELLDRARRLVEIARPFESTVFINDRPDIALLARAHGVHLGQQDMHIHDARTLAGGRLLVGASTSNMDEALDSCRAGADVCGVGPMFATTTKHKPVLAGTAYLREYLAHPETSSTPHLAIGGITGETIDELARCGCAGVAVSSAVCGAKDVRGVCEGIVSALRHGAGLAQA